MLLPVILILLALLAAACLAYGTEPVWASYGVHGIDVIIWSRRLEWPIIFVAILLCLILLGLVISNQRRAWWLIGLLPVLVLFYHRMSAGPAVGLQCVQDLPLVDGSIPGDDMVVGLILDGQPCAVPYSTLAVDPVIIHTGREKPVILFWSAYANRAQAFIASRDLRASDLEIVSTPENALLVYNSRLGEFINGLTGRTARNAVPTGIHQPVNVLKCTWRSWLAAHPDTKLMSAPSSRSGASQPQQPRYAMPGIDIKESRRICVVAATQPIAMDSVLITDRPLNLTTGQTSLLVVRVNGVARAYNRELPADLVPRFSLITDPKHKTAAWIDSDTNSEWSNTGEWVDGPKEMHGTTLSPIPMEDDLYSNVMKFWYPNLHEATAAELATAIAEPAKAQPDRPISKRRRSNH